jgi:hypothetical protein
LGPKIKASKNGANKLITKTNNSAMADKAKAILIESLFTDLFWFRNSENR